MSEIVYVLTNQAMLGLVKIGLTSGSIEDRMRGLDTTALPLPFECFAAWEVADATAAEKALHVAFGDHRVREKREFFRISPDKPTAVDEKKVEFRGEVTSLSKAAVEVANETGRSWSAIAGPAYWKYEDRTLSELRDEAESDDD